MFRSFARVAVLLFLTAGLLSPAHAAKRVALVIGNAAYEHAPPLRNPRNDAQALSVVLMKLGFEVITGVDLKRLQLESKVRDFARAIRGADTALLFYAGHGLQVNGQNYLAPIDAKLGDEADLEFEAVRLATIVSQMERERRTNLVFLDACRDNPLAGNLARSMGTRSVAIGRGLARVESGVGTLIAFATQPGNVALDGSGENSPFTESLLKHIETPNLDVALLMRRVREDVMVMTSDRQVPWSNSSLTGSFAFYQDGTKNPPPAAPQSDVKVATLQKELERLKGQLETQSAPKSADLLQDPRELAMALQKELARVGCDPGTPDGGWGKKSRAAMNSFNAHASLALQTSEPTLRALEVIKARTDRVCPAKPRTPTAAANPGSAKSKVSSKGNPSATMSQCKSGVLSACQRACRYGSTRACDAVGRMQRRGR